MIEIFENKILKILAHSLSDQTICILFLKDQCHWRQWSANDGFNSNWFKKKILKTIMCNNWLIIYNHKIKFELVIKKWKIKEKYHIFCCVCNVCMFCMFIDNNKLNHPQEEIVLIFKIIKKFGAGIIKTNNLNFHNKSK